MKKNLLVSVCVLLFGATSVYAQGGGIAIYSDLGRFDCNLSDKTVGLCTHYVSHNKSERRMLL